MGSLKRRLELVEADRGAVEAERISAALGQLSNEELEALEARLSAEARAKGECAPRNDVLDEIWAHIEAERRKEQHDAREVHEGNA